MVVWLTTIDNPHFNKMAFLPLFHQNQGGFGGIGHFENCARKRENPQGEPKGF